MFFFCNVWSYPWILTCRSLTFNCSTFSFTYSVIFFFIPCSFPFTPFCSSFRYSLPAYHLNFSFSFSVFLNFPPFSSYRTPFSLVAQFSTIYQSCFSLYSISFSVLLFHLLFTTFPFLPFFLSYLHSHYSSLG